LHKKCYRGISKIRERYVNQAELAIVVSNWRGLAGKPPTTRFVNSYQPGLKRLEIGQVNRVLFATLNKQVGEVAKSPKNFTYPAASA